jgi:D-amino peptidase
MRVLAHTIHGGVVADVRCDGRSLGELGLNATLAAHRGVPAVLVSGDDTVAAEAAEVAPCMHTVVVKRALGARAGGCTLSYRAPDFPAAYQVTQLITMLGGI